MELRLNTSMVLENISFQICYSINAYEKHWLSQNIYASEIFTSKKMRIQFIHVPKISGLFYMNIFNDAFTKACLCMYNKKIFSVKFLNNAFCEIISNMKYIK